VSGEELFVWLLVLLTFLMGMATGVLLGLYLWTRAARSSAKTEPEQLRRFLQMDPDRQNEPGS
jgi:hypothetical protein